MKLPEEIRIIKRTLHSEAEEELCEALVRDCAQAAKDFDKRNGGAIAGVILSRYDLDKKK